MVPTSLTQARILCWWLRRWTETAAPSRTRPTTPRADAVLIAHAPSDIQFLLDRNAALQGELLMVKSERDRLAGFKEAVLERRPSPSGAAPESK